MTPQFTLLLESATTANPMVIAGYVAGFMLSLPFLYALVRVVFFFTTITVTLKGVAAGLESVTAEMQRFQQNRDGESQAVEFSFLVIENDVNALQKQAGLEVRRYPDRRTGASGRRKA